MALVLVNCEREFRTHENRTGGTRTHGDAHTRDATLRQRRDAYCERSRYVGGRAGLWL